MRSDNPNIGFEAPRGDGLLVRTVLNRRLRAAEMVDDFPRKVPSDLHDVVLNPTMTGRAVEWRVGPGNGIDAVATVDLILRPWELAVERAHLDLLARAWQRLNARIATSPTVTAEDASGTATPHSNTAQTLARMPIRTSCGRRPVNPALGFRHLLKRLQTDLGIRPLDIDIRGC